MIPNATESTVDLPESRQFRLRAFFTVTTGVALALGLISWRPVLGTLLAVLLVGPWWTWVAYRGRKGNLAYLLAAVTIGSLIGAPMVAAGTGLWYLRFAGILAFPLALVVFCGPPVLAAMLLRRMVRKIGGRQPHVVGLLFCWTVIFLYSVGFGWTQAPTLLLFLSRSFVVILLSSALIVFVSFPLTATLSIPLGWLLWRLDARSIRWTETDLAALAAVGQLWAEDAKSVHAIHVALRLGREYGEIWPRLERLHNAGRLTWTSKRGYRRTD